MSSRQVGFGICAAICLVMAALASGVGVFIAADAAKEEPPRGDEAVLSGSPIDGPYGEPWLVGWVQIGAKRRSQANTWTYDVAYEEVLGDPYLTATSNGVVSRLHVPRPVEQMRDYTIDEREVDALSELQMPLPELPEYGNGYVVRTLALSPGETVLVEERAVGEPVRVWRGGLVVQAKRVQDLRASANTLRLGLLGLGLVLMILGSAFAWRARP